MQTKPTKIKTATLDDLVDNSNMYVEFQEKIEEMVDDGLTYIEAIQEYIENNNIEPEAVTSMISPRLMSKLIAEGKRLNLVKGFGNRIHGLPEEF
jgi:S-adenosylmethionine synthetase